MKEGYPLKEDLINCQSKWTTTENGIQYPRDLAVGEVIYSSLDDNQASKDTDEVQCMRSVWWNFVWSAPPSCASTLVLMSWPDIKAPAVGRLKISHPGLCLSWGKTVPTVPAIQRQHVLLLAHASHHLNYQVNCSLLKGKGTVGTFACHLVVLSIQPRGGYE